MKPMSDWTTEELVGYIGFLEGVQDCLAELLRRERESMKGRAAEVCQTEAERFRKVLDTEEETDYDSPVFHILLDMADSIRGLP